MSGIITQIIEKKRDGKTLCFDEIKYFVDGYTSGKIPDYQMSALLMAIYFKGLDATETSDLTRVMAASGEVLDLSRFGALTADKHSTGGVGDKTTLIVAPIVAAAGIKVAKMSGRGLAFTGGTVDKLQSIPGYRITPSNEEFLSIVENTGVSVVGQSADLVPADKKIYGLRDVTGTVDSIPLIASSIMSKKIAAGAKNIVLDVKFGSGAFMKTSKSATELARTMVDIGKKSGRNTAAVISNMDRPLGYCVGNTLEVIEATDLLKGANIPDLHTECTTIAGMMISLSRNIEFKKACRLANDLVLSGAAYNKFKEWISAQGGDISYIENTDKFKKARYSLEIFAENNGYINRMDTEIIGRISSLLGAGRSNLCDGIDYSVGMIIPRKTGDLVKTGDLLCTLFTNDKGVLDKAAVEYMNAVKITSEKPPHFPQILDIIW